MRIALVSLHFSEYAVSLARGLTELGHTVLLIVDEDNLLAEVKPEDRPSFCQVMIIKRRQFHDMRTTFNAWKLISGLLKFSPEVIHVQETYHHYLAPFMPLLARTTPVVLTIHDHVPHSGADVGRSKVWFTKLIRGAADLAIVHGERIRSELQEIEPRLRGRIRCIPHGILGPRSSTELAAEHGRILFFGRIQKYKGLGVLLRAVQTMQMEGAPVTLTIAGTGPDLDCQRQLIAELSGCELIERFIETSEIPALFQKAMVVALPYVDGTQSGVAALAARYGRPVVASRVGSIPEMVIDGCSGIIVEPADHLGLATALRRLIDDKSLANKLSEGATQMARTTLAWENIAHRTIDAYDAALQLKSAKAGHKESRV